jgi:hypothetical protein
MKRDELRGTIGTLERADAHRFNRSAIEAKVHEHLNAWQRAERIALKGKLPSAG